MLLKNIYFTVLLFMAASHCLQTGRQMHRKLYLLWICLHQSSLSFHVTRQSGQILQLLNCSFQFSKTIISSPWSSYILTHPQRPAFSKSCLHLLDAWEMPCCLHKLSNWHPKGLVYIYYVFRNLVFIIFAILFIMWLAIILFVIIKYLSINNFKVNCDLNM